MFGRPTWKAKWVDERDQKIHKRILDMARQARANLRPKTPASGKGKGKVVEEEEGGEAGQETPARARGAPAYDPNVGQELVLLRTHVAQGVRALEKIATLLEQLVSQPGHGPSTLAAGFLAGPASFLAATRTLAQGRAAPSPVGGAGTSRARGADEGPSGRQGSEGDNGGKPELDL